MKRRGLWALAVVFGFTTTVFALGVIWILANGEEIILPAQAIITGVLLVLTIRIFRAARAAPPS